jgi:molybdopterin converting factor small subunit
MANTINIPTPLRPFTDKKEAVEVSGATVGELLADLTMKYDGLRKHLYTDEGKLRNFVNVYLNDEDIRYLQKEQTPVKSGDTLSIVPSVAGGADVVRSASRSSADLVRSASRSSADLVRSARRA